LKRKTKRDAAEYSTSTATGVVGAHLLKRIPNDSRKRLISLGILILMVPISEKA
jgi:hypothetical protein